VAPQQQEAQEHHRRPVHRRGRTAPEKRALSGLAEGRRGGGFNPSQPNAPSTGGHPEANSHRLETPEGSSEASSETGRTR
jgi:hypothetical protein